MRIIVVDVARKGFFGAVMWSFRLFDSGGVQLSLMDFGLAAELTLAIF